MSEDFEWDDDVKKRAEKKMRERMIVESKGKYDPWEDKGLEEEESDTDKEGGHDEGSKNQDKEEEEEEIEDDEDSDKRKKVEKRETVKAVRTSSRKRSTTVKD